MKQLILFFLLSLCGCSTEPLDPQIQASYDLISRITPGYETQFNIELIESPDSTDIYEIEGVNGKIVLRGNNPISIATAFNQYLKYTCNAQLSWFGDQLNLPKKLPMPEKLTKGTIHGERRSYFNYCSISYTAPWWNWERWQREIDFMAMNSINMPLQTIGLDAVWYKTLRKMGLSDQETRDFLVGPAHQAWQWMPNLESVYGPLPMNWIDSHTELAKQIYKRELELGMQPIQQSFTGYVPKIMKDKYPSAHIAQQPEWYGFEGVYQLDPLDPLFKEMGRKFMESQDELFGSYGLYAADPFHESYPPVEGNDYLNKVGDTIWSLIHDFDPYGTVVMQAWSIREHIATRFPKENLIIMDLGGWKHNKTKNFWGYPFVTGNLHNFGGRINLHGDIPLISSNQYANVKKKAPNVIGRGLFMESVCQNPMYYAMAFEMPLHEGAIDAKEWLDKYATRSYGAESQSAQKAWHILLESAYKEGTNGVESSSMICARPAVRAKRSGPNAGFDIPYDPKQIIEAQRHMLKDVDKLKGSTIYRQDIVDIQRQIMTNLAQVVHHSIADSYESGDMETFQQKVDTFLELLLDADRLLSTRTEWNFDKWVSDARSWGHTKAEKDLYDRDATTLITIWGFTEGIECKIFDYSWREWGGLIRRFYYPRWKMFYEMLAEQAAKGTPYSDESARPTDDGDATFTRESFRANEFYSKLADWEINFADTPKNDIDPAPKGYEVEITKELYTKYSKIAEEYYK